MACVDPSTHALRLGESPYAIEDFGSRAKEAHRVVPALHDRQAVGDLAVAAAELDVDRAVRALLRRDVVERILARTTFSPVKPSPIFGRFRMDCDNSG